MIRIRIAERTMKIRALGYLAGRYSFKSWADGKMLVPPPALPSLACEGIVFEVEGQATSAEQIAAFRDPAPAPV